MNDVPFKIVTKYNKLLQEREELVGRIAALENNYSILTDQYMEGIIRGPIGKTQRKLSNERTKCINKVAKLDRELANLRGKYRLPR